MSDIFNIYCDESCHLENDRQSAMVLGAVWCPDSQRASIARSVRDLKRQYGLASGFEIKWTKISPAKLDFYLALIDLFFSDSRLHFRGVVIPDKSKLNHSAFNQSHDDFYYKMYFQLLNVIFESGNRYRIYLDIKDTRSQQKVTKLHDYLANAQCDFNKEMIERIQQVHSCEIEQLQLADVLSGALSYLHRGLQSSPAKQAVIEMVKSRSGFSLRRSTLPSEEKFNIFIWEAQAV
ncbi:MAG: DUF3800 domain-containing protein [Nitrospirota bacterium]|nr:DUF3800 domain-containing protein [Nitrospirota bacterium]